jgi:transposase
MGIKRIAMDTSKHVFTLVGVDDRGQVLMRRELKRHQVEPFFKKQAPVEVVLEACGGSHHWGRALSALGHRVRLLPAQYVKPFVKRGKNDRHDAMAIAEASARPGLHPVAVKSAEQPAAAMLLSVRELLVRQRTQLVNAMRGHATEFGVVGGKGVGNADALVERVRDDPSGPEAAKPMIAVLAAQLAALQTQITELDRKLAAQHKANAISRMLAEVPGVGRLGALTLALTIEAAQFRSGRHFAAWIGLTPKEGSTGGKPRLGGIRREGNERLRQLLVLGAMAVIKAAKPGSRLASRWLLQWLLQLLGRKPRKLAAVGARQQDGPHPVGHDAQWRSLPARARCGLNRSASPRAKGRRQKMAIGRTPRTRHPVASDGARYAAVVLRTRSRNPSGPAAICRTDKAGHMTALEPNRRFFLSNTPCAQRAVHTWMPAAILGSTPRSSPGAGAGMTIQHHRIPP